MRREVLRRAREREWVLGEASKTPAKPMPGMEFEDPEKTAAYLAGPQKIGAGLGDEVRAEGAKGARSEHDEMGDPPQRKKKLREDWARWDEERDQHGGRLIHAARNLGPGQRIQGRGGYIQRLPRADIAGNHWETGQRGINLERHATPEAAITRVVGEQGVRFSDDQMHSPSPSQGDSFSPPRPRVRDMSMAATDGGDGHELREDWAKYDAARGKGALPRGKKVWMHSQTGHQFYEGDRVKMAGASSGHGRVLGLTKVAGEVRVRVGTDKGEFAVQPDSLRPPEDAPQSPGTSKGAPDWMRKYHEGLMRNTALQMGLTESKQTAALSVTHAPIGKGGKNWVTETEPGNTGQLPAYIQNIRNAIMRDGKPESEATGDAVSAVKRWAAGGGGVSAEVKAAAAKAVGEWEALRGKAHAKSAAKKAS